MSILLVKTCKFEKDCILLVKKYPYYPLLDKKYPYYQLKIYFISVKKVLIFSVKNMLSVKKNLLVKKCPFYRLKNIFYIGKNVSNFMAKNGTFFRNCPFYQLSLFTSWLLPKFKTNIITIDLIDLKFIS